MPTRLLSIDLAVSGLTFFATRFSRDFNDLHFSPFGGLTIVCIAAASILSAVNLAISFANEQRPVLSVALNRCVCSNISERDFCSFNT